MKSEAYLRRRLREIISRALPQLDPEGVWPYPRAYEMEQAQHWFYCLADVLELPREGHESLRHWMERLEKELTMTPAKAER